MIVFFRLTDWREKLIVKDAATGRTLDAQGYHTLLHLGAEGAMVYWAGRAANPSAPETDHRAAHLERTPPQASLLAKLQPAK